MPGLHLSNSLKSQQELGFGRSNINDVCRLVVYTNVILLCITVTISTLHL